MWAGHRTQTTEGVMDILGGGLQPLPCEAVHSPHTPTSRVRLWPMGRLPTSAGFPPSHHPPPFLPTLLSAHLPHPLACRVAALASVRIHSPPSLLPLVPACRVAALAQERIHSPEQQQYWLNLVHLLFAGADACDRALREKVRGGGRGTGRDGVGPTGSGRS